ncbi:MAG: hypothetical protein IKU29_01420, partial [Parabacteroides sp.]|nr:hypothetical protein [Parabacteroides sp.]
MKITYTGVGLFWIWLFVNTFTLSAQEKLELSGKIRVLEPVELRLENIKGEVLQKTMVKNNNPFSLQACKIEPDVYLICFGETKQPIYLTNTQVTIKGFYNCRDVKSSSLNFTGIDIYYELLKWLPKEEFSQDKTIVPEIKGKLKGNMYSALAYIVVDDEENIIKQSDPAALSGDAMHDEYYTATENCVIFVNAAKSWAGTKTLFSEVTEFDTNYNREGSNNILTGKKWVACGDSFTHGDFTGYVDPDGLSGELSHYLYDSVRKVYKTYPYWIAERNNMTLVNEAI